MNDLIKSFSLDRIQSSGAIFDIKKLNWINHYYLRLKSSSEILELAKNYIPHDWNVSKEMIDLIKEKTQKIEDIKEELNIFFKYSSPSLKELQKLSINQLVKNRMDKFCNMGIVK